MSRRIFPDRILTSAERSARYHAKHRKERREQSRWYDIKDRYGLTKSQFESMFTQQEGRCLICDMSMKIRGRTADCVCVDHDHVTLIVRGLLCRTCNTGLGYFQDAQMMHKAAEYLAKYE